MRKERNLQPTLYMKYIEDIGKAPKKMGTAEIVIVEQTDLPGRVPYRKERQIFLPEDSDARFYAINKRQQFLCTVNIYAQRRLFFGGMDESPFLVELGLSHIEELIVGEEAFFESLKPTTIQRWEKGFNVKAKRQGDFFAIAPPEPASWGNFIKRFAPQGLKVTPAEEHMLSGTRHSFTGLIGTSAVSGENGIFIGEGTITAPDHADLVLDHPHVILQSIGLTNPREAD